MKKVFIVCSGNTVTGGPELLHQFSHSLRSQGVDARLLYYPFDKTFSVPNTYMHYDVKQSHISDVQNENVFLSETQTNLIKFFPNSQINIWWLSVDFFYGVKKESFIIDIARYIWTFAFRRKSLMQLKRHTHWAQSHYAERHLAKKGIKAKMLGDYLNLEHKNLLVKPGQKKDIILFNPKKGKLRTKKLIQANDSLKFIPIENMSPREVSDLLESAKVYMDFGNHPGKDRLPREAALAGCCVITGIHGSAENCYDYPIPDNYKLNDRNNEYIKKFQSLVQDIFDDYEKHQANFSCFKEEIQKEKHDFDQSVKKFITQKIKQASR